MAKHLLLCFLLVLFPASPGPASVSLEEDFRNPPPSARPWVYWFWLNGNITREGITSDLEAMRRVGIGGVLIMEVDQGVPVGPVDFMSEPWRELFSHVVREADRLGQQVNMNNDAGWNGSGGPWITPALSMQKVVYSVTEVTGPASVDLSLPQPESLEGYYRDIAVLAFPSVGDYRIAGIGQKAAYQVGGVGFPGSGELPGEMVIPRVMVRDISARMDSSGHLAWDVPEGHWTIVRFGHTSTGARNSPAPASGRGLECDKLSREGVEANFSGMIAHLAADNADLVGRSLVATHVDSWENGSQNWTRRMPEEFARRAGYDPIPFLPVFTGRVVGSLEESERFLWDLRSVISEMVVENYAGRLHQLAQEAGLRFSIEAYGSPCDNLPYAGRCDEPMGEFWTPSGAMETCRAMASAGHVYGKPVIGAEAFTSGDQERWREHPATLKALGDQAFTEGINRFVVHRYAMQPWHPPYLPGMTMGPWGQHYERTQTWWSRSAPWHEYLARCQHMLRQGLYSADICFLQPQMPPSGPGQRQVPGYSWDECPAEVVRTRMTVSDGWIVLPDGMRYRVLVLPDSRAMTPVLLQSIRDLVAAGATVIGPPPQTSPSLRGYPACDDEVRKVAGELWGGCDGQKVTQRRYGRGRVVWGMGPAQYLRSIGVAPDFSAAHPLRWIHRSSPDAEIYFVANSQSYPLTTTASFRVSGMAPELWYPDSGRIEPAASWNTAGGVTRVALHLPEAGSVFVVFRQPDRAADPVVSVRRDGKPLFSVDAFTAHRVLIRSANYGIPGDAARSRDVRARLQDCADSGQFSIPVSQLAAGDDPAPNVVKTLEVHYAIGEHEYAVQGQDTSVVHFGGHIGNVDIREARYGILDDPSRTIDVTKRLQRMVTAGELTFMAARLAAEGDPALLTVKTLEVDYTLDGEPRWVRALDPELVTLAPQPGLRESPCELLVSSAGMSLVANKPGRYTVTRASGASIDLRADLPEAVEIEGPWEVRFEPGLGAPESVRLDRLACLSTHPDPGVRFFSGTAVYRAGFSAPPEWFAAGRRVRLDLGDVQVMAQVRLNGRSLGLLWKPPYRVDLSGAIRPGDNWLEVRVTNLWPNRMVGDELLPEDSDRNPDGTLRAWPEWVIDGRASPTARHTFTTWRLWNRESVLPRSGLIGPVRLYPLQEFSITHGIWAGSFTP